MTPLLFLLLLQTPNLGGVFSHRPPNPLDDPHELATAMMRYHQNERALFAQKTLPAKKIVAHWHRLRPLRRAVERMIASGQVPNLSQTERAEMRRALSKVIEHSVELVYVAASEIDASMFDADEERTVELLKLALLANRWFGLEVREVFGIPVEPGVS